MVSGQFSAPRVALAIPVIDAFILSPGHPKYVGGIFIRGDEVQC